MPIRPLILLSVLVLVAAACAGNGPAAPPISGVQTECVANFCVDFPAGWRVVEIGEDFLSLAHPEAPDEILATVGQVNMEGIVTADGKEWPQPTDSVVRSFWSLIDEGAAELANLIPQEDGSLRSFGTFRGGRLWYALDPIRGSGGIGVEVRAPNSTWVEHAETIMGSLVVVDA